MAGLGAADCRQTRIVCIGSAAEYARDARNPISEEAPCGGASAYGNSKLAQSLACLRLAADAGLMYAGRPPLQSDWPRAIHEPGRGIVDPESASTAPSIQVGNTHTARDFIDVRDAARAYWLLALSGRIGEIYNVCSGAAVRITDLLTLLSRITGHTPRIETDYARIRPDDASVVVGDSVKLRSATRWRPTSTSNGLFGIC